MYSSYSHAFILGFMFILYDREILLFNLPVFVDYLYDYLYMA